MKRVIALIVATLMLLAVFGCAKKQEQVNIVAEPLPEATEETQEQVDKIADSTDTVSIDVATEGNVSNIEEAVLTEEEQFVQMIENTIPPNYDTEGNSALQGLDIPYGEPGAPLDLAAEEVALFDSILSSVAEYPMELSEAIAAPAPNWYYRAAKDGTFSIEIAKLPTVEQAEARTDLEANIDGTTTVDSVEEIDDTEKLGFGIYSVEIPNISSATLYSEEGHNMIEASVGQYLIVMQSLNLTAEQFQEVYMEYAALVAATITNL
jgi:hypothetical protein